MKKLLTTITLFFSISAVSLGASAQLFGPRNFDECILENMTGVESDRAARAIEQSCFETFPPAKGAALSEAELMKLEIEGGRWLDYGTVNVMLYNGNDFSIDNVVIQIFLYREEGSDRALISDKKYEFMGELGGCSSGLRNRKMSSDIGPGQLPEGHVWRPRIISARRCTR